MESRLPRLQKSFEAETGAASECPEAGGMADAQNFCMVMFCHFWAEIGGEPRGQDMGPKRAWLSISTYYLCRVEERPLKSRVPLESQYVTLETRSLHM